MADLITRARALRAIIESMATGLSDEQALEAVELYPAWTAGTAYTAGDRVRYGGRLYRVTQDHTAQDDWTPGTAASLFAEVLPGQDDTPIGEWIQPDSTNPYSKGDRVTWQGQTWESLIDGNVWTPGEYGWVVVEE